MPRHKYRERLTAGTGYDNEHQALLRSLQTQQTNHSNQPGGYWIAETDPAAAHHAITTRRLVTATPWAILATDGAYNTMEHLSLTAWSTVSEASANQLGELLDRCQLWEDETDPSGSQLPRAKRHDDKSLSPPGEN